MKPFADLTRATQRKRLKRLGKVALQRFGIESARLRFISDTANIVFRVDGPDARYALRIDQESPDNKQWLIWSQAELLWLSALRRDTGLAVPEPVAALDGSLVQTVATAGIPEGPAGNLAALDARTFGQ